MGANMTAEIMAEVWRGDFFECAHRGHAVVSNANGDILAQWGDPDLVMLPRSSSKMLQALPLVESGAADAMGLGVDHLAISCASHEGAPLHVDFVSDWLEAMNLAEPDMRCGVQNTRDSDLRRQLVKSDTPCDQRHNNCSGKHCGFLAMGKHHGWGPEYLDINHPLQQGIKAVMEEMSDEGSAGYGIDGCSAPNFGMSLHGFARALARMADPSGLGAVRSSAAERLVSAMAARPDLVAGKGRACTNLMNGMGNGTVVKTGADGVFAAIIPSRGLGVALKIEDGATRGSETAMAALLVRLGAADPSNPLIAQYLRVPQQNWRKIHTGHIIPSVGLFQNGKSL
jgi:L-asparaginase II